jgi:U3 small nucleolar RNA-associated protein 14
MLAVAYATGMASHARQVKGDDPDKKGYPGPPGWGFGVGLTTPHSKKLIVTKVKKRIKLDKFKDDGRKELVTDRKKWKDIVRQAKAHSGL